MYALHRLCKISQDFVFSFNGTARAKSDAFSISLASVIAGSIDLIKVDDVGKLDQFINRLGPISEVLRINVEKVSEYLRKFYQLRKSYAKGLESPSVILSKETSHSDFFGISMYFSKDDLKIIEDEGVQITADMLSLKGLMQELGFFNEPK